MRLALRFALRELRGGLRGFRLFLACLTLGVAAIASVGLVRASIEAGLTLQGAEILGGDAAVELTYRFVDDGERAWMEQIAERVSEVADLRSMAVAGDERGLTQLRAVDDAYPLMGRVDLDPAMPLASAFAGADGLPGGVMEPALATRLGIAPGDTFRLGNQEFVLSALLIRAPDSAVEGLSLGPRSMVRRADLAKAGLLAPGTMFSALYRLDLPAGVDLAALEAAAETRMEGSGIRWRDTRAATPGVSEFVSRLGAFLTLVGLSALIVGGVGIASAVRAYMEGKLPTIATLKTVGASQGLIRTSYGIQIAALAVLGILLGLALALVLVLGLGPWLATQLPVPVAFAPWPGPLMQAALYGGLTAALFSLWPLAQAGRTRAQALYRAQGTRGRPALRDLLIIALLAVLLVVAAAVFSHSLALALWVFGGIALALAVLALAALGAAALAGAVRHYIRGMPTLRAALAAIAAGRGETVAVVTSLGLGLSVLAAVGQVDGTLQRAIQSDLPDVAPSFFFVDIQPGQIDGFRTRINGDADVHRMEAAPMLRGVITRINGQNAREVAGDHWVLRGDRGVTYSEALPENTTLTAGEWWPEGYSGPPQISFADAEAREIGLKIGDTLTVNILGRDIEARIASFREVSFETAGIGFVMAMNPAALAGAPHSWIATVYAAPKAEAAILRDVTSAYPNVTGIAVGAAIAQAAQLLAGIAGAIRWAALATLLTGGLVLIGAGLAGARARVFEAAVLKTVGATRAQVLTSLACRALILGLVAGAVALMAGMLAAWAVAHFLMDLDYAVIWSNAVLVLGGGILAAVLAGLAFAIGPLRARPARVLRGQD